MPEETAELPVSPQEVQIQSPSFLDKLKTHKFKILGGVLGVLVFAGAVFGAYKLGQKQVQPAPQPTPTPMVVATPTPDPTANWKTYTNTKYGYSIKLPQDWGEWSVETGEWKFSSIIDQLSNLVLLGNDEPVIKTDEGIIIPPQKIDIEVHLNKTKSEWLAELQKPGGECLEEATFIGEAVSAAKILCPGFHFLTYLVERGVDLYRITKGKEFAEFDFMLSTFRFLEEGLSGYYIHGNFIGEGSQKITEPLRKVISNYSASLLILESYPVQFQIVVANIEDCEKIRKTLPSFEFIRSFGECRERGW